jgi:hypothetical protein
MFNRFRVVAVCRMLRVGSSIALVVLMPLASVARGQTGTFIDRQLASDLRVVSYNIYFDSIFPNPNRTTDEKFARVIKALDPDILNLQEIYSGSTTAVQNLLNTIRPLPNDASWYVRKGTDNVIASKYPFQTISAMGGGEVIGLVNLPDEQYPRDFFFSNNHYACCGGVGNDPARQNQSDDIMRWFRDYRSLGGVYDLPQGTPFAIVGDLNIVGGPGPLDTLITGNISNETAFGSDFLPDWDDSHLTDAHPYHNGSLAEDYTWRDDLQNFDPGRLDYIIYSDSALDVGNKFILNTVAMSAAELEATGLQQFDIVLDNIPAMYDHLPLVVDFRIFDFSESDFNYSRTVDATDLATWQSNYGLASGATRAQGDANGDGQINGRDFLIWQRQSTGGTSSIAAVPEPASFTMLVGALGIVMGLVRMGCR